MNLGVDVHQDAVCRKSLRTVGRDSIAVIEMAHFVGVEGDHFSLVHPDGELAVFSDALDGAEVTVGNTKLLGRRGEDETVANGKFPLHLAVARSRGAARDYK